MAKTVITKTNYSESWLAFRKSDEYKRVWDILKKHGYKPNQQRYANNLLREVFNAGWGNKKIYITNKQH